MCPDPSVTFFILGKFGTSTGVYEEVTPWMPNWPTALSPQQYKAEASLNAQAWLYAVDTDLIPVSPLTFIGTRLPFVSPVPNIPAKLSPQQ